MTLTISGFANAARKANSKPEQVENREVLQFGIAAVC